MSNFMEVIAIIPARGGSKGIPQKNLIHFCGNPLLAWSILQAKNADLIKKVYVSSDNEEILSVAGQYGAEAILRPSEISTDTSTSESALIHSLDRIENSEKIKIDLIVFLQATSPLRESIDIDNAISKILKEQGDSLLSVCLLDDLCAFRKKGNQLYGITYDPYKRGRRQDREPIYHDNGSIYIFKPEILRKFNNRIGGKTVLFEMPFWKFFEIDTWDDVEICEFFFKKYILNNRKTNEKDQLCIENVDLIVYDFDGVMTDNHVMVMQDGSEAVAANRSDGLGIEIIKNMSINQVILSTESNPVVSVRAKKLGIPVIQGSKDKAASLRSYCHENNLNMERVIYVGNDVNDFDAMINVGIAISPFDAHPDIKAISKIVLKSKGGSGVARELADLLNEEYGLKVENKSLSTGKRNLFSIINNKICE